MKMPGQIQISLRSPLHNSWIAELNKVSFIPGGQAQAQRARLSAWELLGASCGSTTERRAADYALRSSVLQRHFRVWIVTPGRKRFFSLPVLQASKQLFMSHWWHLQAFRGFGSAWGEGVCAVTAVTVFASSRRNPNLVANAALQCLWHFCLVDVLYEPSFFNLGESYWQEKEASAFIQWYKLEFNTAPNNWFKDLTQP